jgi:gentisate 1,2-dioxygenase
LVERFLRLEKVDFITGTVFSNIVVAIAPDVVAAKTFFVAPNAGPAWASHEARGGAAELFVVTDRAIYERLDLLREEIR